LKDKKIIIFTEFIDTANDIYKLIKERCTDKVMLYTGKSSKRDMDDVLFNFDANVKKSSQKNDYRILIATDTLSHGVNLHRSNVIINFDIPWNPTKIMQRVGRVQRLGTDFDEVYIYNFFPTDPIEENIQIESLAKNKIAMFIELLGNDSQLLTDEPIRSFDLFDRINSNALDEEEFVDDELKYLHLMRDIRDNDKELFKKIEEIPKKARVARKSDKNYLITLLKTGKFKKVFKSSADKTEEIDFFDAIKELKASPDEKGLIVDRKYYDYLDLNLNAFKELLFNPDNKQKLTRKETSILSYINAALSQKALLASYDINFLTKVKDLVIEGHITKNQAKRIHNSLKDNAIDAESTIASLRKNIKVEDLKTTTNDSNSDEDIKEIVLSEYFK
jgi:superfamily II DNA/RNA helicase